MVANAQSIAPADAKWGRNFLIRPLPLTLIFGTFFGLTLPLVFLESVGAFDGWRMSPTFLFVAIFGMSHFLITFPIYLNKANIEHFTSSIPNIIYYFVIPFGIVAIIAVLHHFRAWERGAGIIAVTGFWVFLAMRGIDFYHVVKQSFGVLELTKGQAKLTYAPATKVLSRVFFMAMFLLQMHTFTHGRVFTAEPLSVGLAVVGGGLFLTLLTIYVRHWIRAVPADKSYALVPIAYLICQGTCAALAAYKTLFYLAALGMHYMEYHILMQPRVFANLSKTAKLDHIMAAFKKHQWLFYALLAGISLFIYAGPRAFNNFEHPLGGTGWIFWVYVAQATIATLHFYIDAFLWRFSNPFYRKTLGPLYFKG